MAAVVEFGPFRLDVHRRTLTREGHLVSLNPRPLDILCCLAIAEHHRLSKDELINAIWPNAVVDENHLHVLMSGLRKTLGQSGREYLVTVPGHGYRLVVSSSTELINHAGREQPTVVILPLKNLMASPLLEPICFGFMEDLATDLSRTRWISTILLDRMAAEDPRITGIGPSYLLAGSLRHLNNSVRINLRLVDITTGVHVWSTYCDAGSEAGFPEWDQITIAVSATIEVAILDAEQRRLMSKKCETPHVWEMFAQAAWHFTRARFDDNERAKVLLEQTTRLDPGFAPAYQWLAYTHIQHGNHYRTCSVARACGLAEPVAAKALDTDCGDAGSHAALGFVAKTSGDARRGLACSEQALAINPNEGDALRLKGGCQIALGLHEEGARTLLFSTRLRPLDPQNWRCFEHLASSAHMQGDYEAAIKFAYEAHRLNQHQIVSYTWLISALAHAGRVEEAQEVIAKARLSRGPRPFDECVHYQPLYLSKTDHGRVLEGMRIAGWQQ